MHPHPSLAHELAASASALRALARDLIGGDDADDLVQEALLRAWRSPPAETHGLRPWLATIVRNLAKNHRRDARRRQQREEAIAASRAATGCDPCPGQHEALRAVTDALWRLPEPYQHTLALRYFAGLGPRRIAARDGTKIATVKSRLQRGLALLRRDLEQRDDRWRPALAAAAGVGALLHPTTIGVLLMTSTTKLLLGGLAVAAAATFLWFALRAGADPPRPTGRTTAAADAPIPASDREAAVAPDERSAVAAASAAAEPALAHPFAFRIDCRVRDRDGLIVPDAKIAIAPRDNALNEWPEAVGDDGVVRIEWRAKASSMAIWVGLVHGRRSVVLRELTVHAGQPADVVLLAGDGGGGDVCDAALRAPTIDCRQCHEGTVPPHLFPVPCAVERGLHPFALFVDPNLGAGGANDIRPPAAPPPPVPAQPKTDAAIEGVVRTADGQPLAGATVVWTLAPDVPAGRSTTRGDGSFRLRNVAPGAVELVAGGGAHGRARARVDVAEGRVATRDLLLRPERGLAGRVLVDAGTATDGWRVEYVADDESWTDGADVGPDGTFALADLPSQRGRLLLWTRQSRLPAAWSRDAVTGGEVVFDLRGEALPRGRLRLAVASPPPADPATLAAYAFQLDTGRGAVMTQRAADGAFELDELPAGYCRVVLVGGPCGRFDLGEHWVDGVALVDLGSCRPPATGRLRITGHEPFPGVELYARRPDLDVRAVPVPRDRGEMLLPAGEWLLLWPGATRTELRPFAITGGETVEFGR